MANDNLLSAIDAALAALASARKMFVTTMEKTKYPSAKAVPVKLLKKSAARRGMSEAGRQRIAEAQRQRWAKQKRAAKKAVRLASK